MLPLMDYAQLTLPHSSIGMSPFELINGRLPRTSFDWNTPMTATVAEKLGRNKARKIATRMQEAWRKGKELILKAQEKKRQDVDKHRKPVDFGPGDQVYVTTKNWKTERTSRKLDHQTAGPFRILNRTGNSYEVDLPDSIKVHNVFSPDRIRKAGTDPLPGQIAEPQPPIIVNTEKEWEVQEVLASKLVRNKLRYRINWLGHDEDLDWYPASDIKYAPAKLREYHIANPDQPGPPKQLQNWIKV